MTDYERSNQLVTIGECERVHQAVKEANDVQFKALHDGIDKIAGEIASNRKWLATSSVVLLIAVFGGGFKLLFMGGIPSGAEIRQLTSKVDIVCQKVDGQEKRLDMDFLRVNGIEDFINEMQTYLKKDQRPGAFGRFGQVERKRENTIAGDK